MSKLMEFIQLAADWLDSGGDESGAAKIVDLGADVLVEMAGDGEWETAVRYTVFGLSGLVLLKAQEDVAGMEV